MNIIVRVSKKKNILISVLLIFLAAVFLIPSVSRYFNRKQVLMPVRLLVVGNLSGTGLTLPRHWVADSLSVGDVERSPSGKVLARLKGIQRYEEGFNKVAILDVELSTSEDPLTGQYSFKQKDLLIGSTLELALGRVLVFGEVISFPDKNKPADTEIIVTGYLYSQRDWLVDAISVGDIMTSGKEKEVAGKILSKQIFPANTEYRVDEGFILGKNSARYRDIKVTLSLKVEKRDTGYVFASLQPVKVNNRLDLPFDKYNIYGLQVVSFSEK